jgi:amino acid permease
MTKPVPLIAALLGLVSLALAAVYWLIPAGSLPSFLPGFQAGSDHIHVNHALGSLIVALILFALAWFQRGSAD